MRGILKIGILIIGTTLLTGCGADKALKKADAFYALGEYYDAAAQYKKAYAQTPAKEKAKRGELSAKMAVCYRRTNATSKAIAAYNNVIRYKKADSLTHLYLAQQLMKNGSYKDAAKNFQIAIDSLRSQETGGRRQEYLSLARNGLKAARQAPDWKKEGSAYSVKRMEIFNSRRADYSPMLAGDDNDILYFTSTRNEAQGDEYSGITGTKAGDIFFSQKDDKDKWGRPQSIDSELNTDFDEGACAFSPDGRTMYLTQCVIDANYPRMATVVASNRSDAAWSKATAVQISKDTLSSYAHPAVSPDGEWLYFVSDMPGGMGGYDIWRCRLYGNNETGGAENLGASVNTSGDEITSWTIEHPGFPLNSQGDDFGMTFEGMKNQGFFSSNRGDARGFDHIYSFFNPDIIQTVKGWVYEQEGYELPAAQVYMVGNDGTNLRLSVRGDGSFEHVIKPNVDYVLMASCKGYLNHQEQLRVTPVKASEEYVLQFPLYNISAPVLIENIFYDFDKATLRPESSLALDSLVDLLNQNPHITIELSAHTDYKGSDQYNERLSQQRAESVVRYLIQHGIASDRLTPKGYGEGNPKTIKKRVAEKYPFLKEGDKLTEEFITALPEEQQEPCNQLNRRTEFRVLQTTYGMFDKAGRLIQSQPAEEQPTD